MCSLRLRTRICFFLFGPILHTNGTTIHAADPRHESRQSEVLKAFRNGSIEPKDGPKGWHGARPRQRRRRCDSGQWRQRPATWGRTGERMAFDFIFMLTEDDSTLDSSCFGKTRRSAAQNATTYGWIRQNRGRLLGRHVQTHVSKNFQSLGEVPCRDVEG